MIKVSGLWLNMDKNGHTYMSGYFGEANIIIYKNKYKTDENKQPDYNLFVAEKTAKKEMVKNE